MKKVLPIILILIFTLTGIAAAEAPIKVLIDISENGSSYDTSVVVNSGDQIAIQLGETKVTLEVQDMQDGNLQNFKLDPALQVNDEEHGIADIAYFLLPAGRENQFTEPGKDSPVLTVSWEELTMPEPYADIIDRVTAVLEKNGEAGDDFSVIFSMLAGTDYAKNAGFYVADLDGNGTPELLLGEFQTGMKAPVFYDMYTIKNNEPVHVFDGWDRSRYYLCENGGIAHEGSNSAFNSFTSLNYYTDGELRLMESIIYDSNANPNYQWFLSTSSESEVDADTQPLAESDAKYNLALYPYKQVTLDNFIK